MQRYNDNVLLFMSSSSLIKLPLQYKNIDIVEVFHSLRVSGDLDI